MDNTYPLCRLEQRPLDGFDMIKVLGLLKEYNLHEIWRCYLKKGVSKPRISMYVEAEHYFLELHLQKMDRIILSEKFNANPFFMQQVVQRAIASHPHELILDKIKNQGIDTGDNPIALSCSMGDTIVDLLVNQIHPRERNSRAAFDATPVEREEQRPLDIYDISSILYLCQQDLTESIFQRYQNSEQIQPCTARPSVELETSLGEYRVHLSFQCISTKENRVIRPPGNASTHVLHQVAQRMNFGHSPGLIMKELKAVGLSLSPEQVSSKFTLSRIVNNTWLKMDFEKSF
ncbi:MAG: hypothetical protein ACP5M0_02430 [Desulfomonilaceae bacterium]